MAIAQMSWGRMRHPISDARMAAFAQSLDQVYRDAERHLGFIWRISDEASASQLSALGFDDQTSATLSLWQSVGDLKSYTFSGRHGEFLSRSREWFEKVNGPQLVIWDVGIDERPTFGDAFERLDHLKQHGASDRGYGWPA